jgi:molybdopterin/thiamine biosynthesis adenylyltransferase
MTLSALESQRYARHIVLKGMGAIGQQKLKAARVLVIGAGGLGSPIVAYLAAAGIGTIGIADADHVSLSNLQRQIVHTQAGLNTNKAESAAVFARNLNSDISIAPISHQIDLDNGAEIIASYDVIIDGTDRFSTRALIADLAQNAQKTLISGAVSMFDGQVTVFAPHLLDLLGGSNPRFVDLYPETPADDTLPACEEAGILGATTGVIGTLMSVEAIKVITGIGTPLIGRLLLYDGRNAGFSELKYKRRNS